MIVAVIDIAADFFHVIYKYHFKNTYFYILQFLTNFRIRFLLIFLVSDERLCSFSFNFIN